MPRLTYSNVIATLALFIALGGSSYAAIKITGRNVTDRSLTGKDIKKRSVPLNRLKGTLPAAARGAKGDPGAKGDAGQGRHGSARRAGPGRPGRSRPVRRGRPGSTRCRSGLAAGSR